jgi:hypothetical protein
LAPVSFCHPDKACRDFGVTKRGGTDHVSGSMARCRVCARFSGLYHSRRDRRVYLWDDFAKPGVEKRPTDHDDRDGIAPGRLSVGIWHALRARELVPYSIVRTIARSDVRDTS